MTKRESSQDEVQVGTKKRDPSHIAVDNPFAMDEKEIHEVESSIKGRDSCKDENNRAKKEQFKDMKDI